MKSSDTISQSLNEDENRNNVDVAEEDSDSDDLVQLDQDGEKEVAIESVMSEEEKVRRDRLGTK